MSTTVQISSNSYQIPSNNETGGTWGEDLSSALLALISKVNAISSNNDISPTTATLLNNITTNTAISGLSFSSSTVSAATITYYISRTVKQTGTLTVLYTGVGWNLIEGPDNGDAGIVFDINSSGQVVYQSTNDINGTIKYFAKTISV